ncbi:MAG: cupredoxin domain-containing protein, partial [Nitrososphaerales archaeon]
MPVGTLTRQVTLGALIAVIGASVLFGATLYLSPAQTSNTLQPNCPNPCQIIIENDIYGNGQPVTVAVGTEVIWVNNDSTQHTVTSDNGAFGSQIINPRDSFSFAFNQPGTYTYHDEIHPMTGIIIVGPPYTYSTSSTTTSGNTLQPNCPNPCEIIINNSVYGNFQPVTVAVGTEVIWVNNDATQHTVIEDNGAFSSPIINPGDNFSYIFNQPGTYNYHDEIHPMTGIIIVGPPYN